MLERHVTRAAETLREADRLLHGVVGDVIDRSVKEVEAILGAIDLEESRMVAFDLDGIRPRLVPYIDHPFAQGLAFNHFCIREGLSHTKAMKEWPGGHGAVAARNLVFLPPVYAELWENGDLDKTRLIAIANRNLTEEAYLEIAELVRTRRKEDVDEKLLKLPPSYLRVGRRGPEQALEAADQHGWTRRFGTVEIAEDLVDEAQLHADEEPTEQESSEGTPAEAALRNLRAALHGVTVAEPVVEALRLSPDPQTLVEKFLTAHRHSDDPDPEAVSQTLFFAHAGPMQKLVADDKFLLRHFRPVKTQKRGQLFYRILEAVEDALQERAHLADLEERGLPESEAVESVRQVLLDLNQDPNRFLVIPEAWLGEVTRRHLYFGSRTRKEGAAYKWFRKIGDRFYLGGHKTADELEEKAARKLSKASS